MSRIGKAPITIPSGVDITINEGEVIVNGPKGRLSQNIGTEITALVQDGTLTVQRPTEQKRHKALHGLYRSLIYNMVRGVTEGYSCNLELVGVGYKAIAQGNVLELNLGYSHNIFLEVPSEIKVSAEAICENESTKNKKDAVWSFDIELPGRTKEAAYQYDFDSSMVLDDGYRKLGDIEISDVVDGKEEDVDYQKGGNDLRGIFTVKPGGTGKPNLPISPRFAPLPPNIYFLFFSFFADLSSKLNITFAIKYLLI